MHRFIVDGHEFFNIPYPLIDENPNWTSFWDYGAPWDDGTANPWANGDDLQMTPFDQKVCITCKIMSGITTFDKSNMDHTRSKGMYNM